MRRPWILLLPLTVGAILSSCDRSPTPPQGPAPPDTLNTLWTKVVSADSMPDTLYYGAAVSFEICIGDSDGDTVSASVSGLPAGRSHVTRAGDTTFVTMSFPGDSLRYDSLYTIRVRASGVDSIDTLSLTYPLIVIDTNRLGGIRKLVAGMWWTTVRYDTLVKHKDTANVEVYTRDTLEHHTRSEVKAAVPLGRETWWQVVNTDTLIDSSKVTRDTTYLRQTASAVEYYSFVPLLGVDTVRVTAYKLPLVVGSSWNLFTLTGDTATRVPIGVLPVRLHFYYDWSGAGRDSAVDTYSFDRGRVMHVVASSTGLTVSAIAETTIVLLTDTIMAVGDTVMRWNVDNTAQQGVCPDLGIGLWTVQREYKRERNYVTGVVVNDTTRSSTMVTSCFDPRTGVTLVK